MLIATNYLSKEKYLKYRAKGINIFLFNEINFSTVGIDDVEFLNCNSEKIASTWFTWDENDKILQAFKVKYPRFFNWNGSDMTLAFQKMLFWTNYKTGFLWYCKNKFYPDEKIFYIDPLHPYNIIKSTARYFKVTLSKKKTGTTQAPVIQDKVYGIHLKDDFELGLYQYFIREIAGSNKYRLFYDKKLNDEKISSLKLDPASITYLGDQEPVFNFPAIALSKVRGTDWYVLTSLLRHWGIINYWMSKAECLASSGIKKIMVNEAENGIYGACIGEVMRHRGVEVFNTMNGLKAGQAQDAHINFDKWFVWDDQMKSMLMEKCGLEENRLIVAGHLMEDFTADYTFQNTLGFDQEKLKGKKVISVFSIRSKRETKMSSLKYLYDLVRNDESLFLIIRPHPAEKPGDYVVPGFKSDRILWISYNQENSKATLYDQIHISDVCVVYGSTVALECKWFGKPCITFEPRKTSLLYFVDGYHTILTNDIDNFKTQLNKLMKRERHEKMPGQSTKVATRIAAYLEKN